MIFTFVSQWIHGDCGHVCVVDHIVKIRICGHDRYFVTSERRMVVVTSCSVGVDRHRGHVRVVDDRIEVRIRRDYRYLVGAVAGRATWNQWTIYTNSINAQYKFDLLTTLQVHTPWIWIDRDRGHVRIVNYVVEVGICRND